jgi:hypothetical protein
MQYRRILLALTGALVYGLGVNSIVNADTIVVDDQVQVRDSGVNTPKRGSTMSDVEAKFGAPSAKHDAVGAPPITRWDYPNFSVFFEHDRVIHAVVTTSETPHAPEGATPASAPASGTPPADSGATNPTG